MSIIHLKRNKALRAAGEQLGRAKIAQRVIDVAAAMDPKTITYIDALKFAGRLKAICQAAGWDDYWSEKVEDGYVAELNALVDLAGAEQRENG